MGDVRQVRIDAYAEGIWRCRSFEAVVCIDVLLAATTLVTSVAKGRATFTFGTGEAPPKTAGHDVAWDWEVAGASDDAGRRHLGPAALDRLPRNGPSLALVSELGGLLAAAPMSGAVYVACLRNLTATVEHVEKHHRNVAIVATGHQGKASFEDEMAAAWLGRSLRERGFAPADRATAVAIDRWSRGEVGLIPLGKSAERLRALGRQDDVAFVTSHVDDVGAACRLFRSQVRAAVEAPRVPEQVLGRLSDLGASISPN